MEGAPVEVVDVGPEKGRGLFTTRPLVENEVILEERPLICCQLSWNRFYGYKSCDYCLKPLESPQDNARRLLRDHSFVLPVIPGASDGHFFVQPFQCSSCGVEYCSEACRAASASEYHFFICCRGQENPFFQLEKEWRESHLLPETGTIMLLVRIAAAHFSAHFCQCEQAQHIVTALSRFVSSPIVELPSSNEHDPCCSPTSLTHIMMGPKFSGNLARLHALFLEVLGEMVQRTGVFISPNEASNVLQQIGLRQLLSLYGFSSAMCLIGRNGQGIGTSSLGAWGKAAEKIIEGRGNLVEKRQFSDFLDSLYEKLDETAGDFLDVEGVGLYERQSLINHSCEPNASVRFELGTNELSIVANEDIGNPGTEVTICYFDECMLSRGVHSRRKYLREHYLFVCKCPRCIREKDDGAESETTEEEDDKDESMDE
ncbi:SET and MYND domain-containing protein 5 [Echinococcus granulosus]|uniref:SET and MYND domain containing protein 5 n=1 Tax=Echinococcus granulosus TaxID=6210 RepID=A0A068WBJ4_ECHGR|nr:SET and MYND domain-containing protein 5 [Echinococcus granulosus]CDS15738.1 SET and MYND domain containing protein 5 [Echinococcus granulosus]